MTTLVWLTADLRLQDNPALNAALASGGQVLLAYLWMPDNPAKPQGASRWWLHHSLTALAEAIVLQGGELQLLEGPVESLLTLAQSAKCEGIFFSRSHEPWLAAEQKRLADLAALAGIACKQFAGQLLREPDAVWNQQSLPFRVFTPFYKNGLLDPPSVPKPCPALTGRLVGQETGWRQQLDAWQWLPTHPNWASGFTVAGFVPGEAGAWQQLAAIADTLPQYGAQRDLPAVAATSRLSPHLRFGEISPRALYHAVINRFPAGQAAAFLRQLYWRDFSYYILWHFPHTLTQPFQSRFAHHGWQPNPAWLAAWQRGLTGYPLVDAGMKELWQTGWMHNRVRMVVASFLTKHLLQPWQAGAAWFWDTLLDADIANNTAGWQWVAGTGADAAPYFRIFNPITQSEKFDSEGHYIRRYLPQLAALPNDWIHKPWQAPASVLAAAGVTLGQDYPRPLVDHAQARAKALAALAT